MFFFSYIIPYTQYVMRNNSQWRSNVNLLFQFGRNISTNPWKKCLSLSEITAALKQKNKKNQWIHSYDYKLPYNIQRPLYPIAVYTGHITNFKQRASLPAYTFRYPLILSTQANTWIYALQTEEEQHSRLILKEASKQKYLTFTFSVWRFSEYKTCEKH